MIIGKVTGVVVSTQKDEGLRGHKLLVVQDVRLPGIEPDTGYLVAVDNVGAGIGEIVLTVSGSSARMAEGLRDQPVDAAIIAIVDTIEAGGEVIYSKLAEVAP